jgi:hypothetical protein
VKRGDDAASTELVSLEKFKDFVRRVVSVPKKEIDRRLAEQRKHRAAKRAGRS